MREIKPIKIRAATIDDAKALCKFMTTLDNESDYLLYGYGERSNTHEARRYLLKIEKNKKSAVFIAENTNFEIVGYICGEVFPFKRMEHSMKVNIGVLKKYQFGVGRLLGNVLLEHAKKLKLVRLEITIIKENKKSFNICKKFGFEEEGIKKKSIKIGNTYHDEHLLSKLL